MSTETANSNKGIMEKAPGFASGIADFSKHFNAKTVTAGVVAAVFGCTGPALIIMNAAQAGKLTPGQTISWLFAVYFFGGLISIFFGLKYKQPINGAWSIPGAVMLIDALKANSISDAAGAYLLAGIIVLILGLSGLIGKVMKWLPVPIVMAMIAGAMIRFGTGIVTSTKAAPLIGFLTLAGYFLAPKISKKLPPILTALVLGIAAAGFAGQLNFSGVKYTLIGPELVIPTFGTGAILSIAIPLAVLVMGAENAQAYGVLVAQGYKPPINAMTIVSGIGGMITAFFGGHNANIAGPMTAICSSEEAGEAKEGRYVATVVNGVLFGGFGLIASIAVTFVSGLPSSLISIVAGLAMIGVLISSFEYGFSTRKFRTGAFFALVIAMSGITILKISSPFWALLGGVLVSLIAERKDFEG
ncbi:MAG: benzoate/H(+) symporter BenE family transporter [Peptococcaceae bacterium]|jgi:benzoate membrane transport protein|nr:benzoate/H(+) symporter BenE family transporter [Peptococcaceae bacterium]MDH7525068.1 benzoate/H(+) symporter BenE family transporter [Peptococcaceae bacterium]